MSRCRRGRSWKAGVGVQRSLLPGRAQRETQVATDVSPPWGNSLLGLCVLYQGLEKDRAEGGVSTGWTGNVRDSVRGEASAQETGSVREDAVPG